MKTLELYIGLTRKEKVTLSWLLLLVIVEVNQ